MTPHALWSLALLAGLAQAATVEVEFIEPLKFSDIGTGVDAESAQKAIAKALTELGSKKLPAQQTLKIAITDVDLAGHLPPPTTRPSDVRVMNGKNDWPRIQLRFKLTEGDKVLAEGEEKLADMNYLSRQARNRPGQLLPYETRMLGEWFDARFKTTSKPSGKT